MKKKIASLILAGGLCVTSLSLTACGSIGEIYDFFTNSDVGEMFENLDELDTEDIKNVIENLDESDFEGLLDDLSDAGDDTNSESGDYSYNYEVTSTDDASDAGDSFDLGNIDGNIYSNSFLGLMCEFDTSWSYYNEDEMALLNNITVDILADAGYDTAKKAMEAGISYVIMCVQNPECGDLVNISMSYSSIDYSKYLTPEEMLDASMGQLEEVYSGDTSYDYTDFSRETATFMGETVPCINAVLSVNGETIYQKQVLAMFSNYTAVVTATSYIGEEKTQEYLNSFSAY